MTIAIRADATLGARGDDSGAEVGTRVGARTRGRRAAWRVAGYGGDGRGSEGRVLT